MKVVEAAGHLRHICQRQPNAGHLPAGLHGRRTRGRRWPLRGLGFQAGRLPAVCTAGYKSVAIATHFSQVSAQKKGANLGHPAEQQKQVLAGK